MNFFSPFFMDFRKKLSNFLKKYDQPWVQLFRPPGAKNHIFRIFPTIFGTWILLEKSEKYDFLLQGAWTIVLKVNFPKTWFWQIGVFTKYRCFNAPKRPQMPQKWIRTIPFGSGHTLGTLTHGLGPLFAVLSLFLAPGVP